MLVVTSNNGKLIIQLEWPNVCTVASYMQLATGYIASYVAT